MREFMRLLEDGLPMDDASRMARAKELGFTIPAYHGTKAAFNEFDVEKGKPSIMGGHAPHFSATKAEAKGYASRAKGAQVLEVLLRVHKPLVISYNTMLPEYSPAEFKAITGEEWTDAEFQPTGKRILQALQDNFGWADHKANWVNVYRVLSKHGFDALLYPDMLPDHSAKKYDKYVVFNPKNVRLTTAAFDPSQSESSNLRA